MNNAATMRSTYERISAGDLAGFGDLIADDFVEHEEVPGLPATKAGVLEYFRLLLSAFPDMRMDVEDLIAADDKSVARVRATATHDGEFMGVPATGKRITMQLIDIMRFDEAGLVREHWGVADLSSLMQQLGADSDQYDTYPSTPQRTPSAERTPKVKIIATHDVDDVQHWFDSPKRAEFFEARGMKATAFRDPAAGSSSVAVLIETPDVETLEKALTEPEAAEAEKYDGVRVDTLRILLAE